MDHNGQVGLICNKIEACLTLRLTTVAEKDVAQVATHP
jgi:hypothetical protein